MAITFAQGIGARSNITVTGYSVATPCTFADVYAADLAATNGRQLLNGVTDADPDTFDLGSKKDGVAPTQPWCSDSYAVPLKIVCTARAGATCDITGTDGGGATISETAIDISSGAATTTKKFRTVATNGITTNGLTIGDDFDIFQDRWGSIGKLETGTLFAIAGQTWLTETQITMGDLANNIGYFSTKKELIYSVTRAACLAGYDNSKIYVGELVNSQPANGSFFVFDGADGTYNGIIGLGNDSGENAYLYGYDIVMKFIKNGMTGAGIGEGHYGTGGVVKNFYSNCKISSSAQTSVTNAYVVNSNHTGVATAGATSNINIWNLQNYYALFFGGGLSDTMSNCALYGVRTTDDVLKGNNGYRPMYGALIDCIFSDTKIQYNGAGSCYRCSSLNIKVTDKGGNGIPNAQVEIKDTNNQVVSYLSTTSVRLDGNHTAATTSLVTSSSWLTAGFAIGDIIITDHEFMLITNIGGTGNKTATVTRAYYSQYSATSHAGNNFVYKVAPTVTDANGDIMEYNIALKHYLRTIDNWGSLTLTDTMRPHTISITASGYKPYKSVITMPDDNLEGTELEIALSTYSFEAEKWV